MDAGASFRGRGAGSRLAGGWLARLVAAIALILIVLVIVIAILLTRGSRPAGAVGGAGAPATGIAAPAAGARPEIAWEGACIPKATAEAWRREVRAAWRATGESFGPMCLADHAALAAAADRLTKAGHGLAGSNLAERLRAVWGLEVAAEARVRNIALAGGKRAARTREAIFRARAAGESVVGIAAHRRLPPMAVFRVLARGKKHRQRDRAALPPDLARELPEVEKADLGSAYHQTRSRARAGAFEAALEAHLVEALGGRRFRTEEDLRAAGAEVTPDVLLDKPVDVVVGRGPGAARHTVNWFDAKNYPGIDAPHLRASSRRQIEKYAAAFGPGAVVYAGGVMCGSRLEGAGAVLLDGSWLATGAGAPK